MTSDPVLEAEADLSAAQHDLDRLHASPHSAADLAEAEAGCFVARAKGAWVILERHLAAALGLALPPRGDT